MSACIVHACRCMTLSEAAADELASLQAIYGEEAVRFEAPSCVSVQLLGALLRFTLLPDYPLASPAVEVALRGRPELASLLEAGLANAHSRSGRDVCLFAFLEWAREQLSDDAACGKAEEPLPAAEHAASPATAEPSELQLRVAERIRSGEPLTERRSVFQAHCCACDSAEEVRAFVDLLLSNRRLASATHNVLAYRIELREGVWAADCDDDGENAAGGRLLHLLGALRARNVAVVVSRWFGGIHLHGDRFKLFNQVARALLDDCGFVPPPEKRA